MPATLPHWTRPLAAGLLVTGLAGCVAVSSTGLDYGARSLPEGLHYAAPKGLIRVELIETSGEFLLAVSEPFFVGDPKATFVLDASSGWLADQEYLFVVNPRTRLLSRIDSASEGQAATILGNIAETAGAIYGAPTDESARRQPGETLIYTRVIDPFESEACDFGEPCRFDTLNAALRQQAHDYLGCDDPLAIDARVCDRIAAHEDFFALSLTPLFSLPDTRRPARTGEARRCHDSLCYRAPQPYSLGVRVRGVTDIEELVMLPNEAPIQTLSLPAGVFANAYARVELFNGMPAIMSADRDNEIAAASAVPISILNSFLSGVSQVVQFRINYNSERVRAATDEVDTDTALFELRQLRDALEDEERAYDESRGDPEPDLAGFEEGPIGDAPPLAGGDESARRPGDVDPAALLETELAATPQGLVFERDALGPRLVQVRVTRRGAGGGGATGEIGE